MKQALLLFFIFPVYLLHGQTTGKLIVRFSTGKFELTDHYRQMLDSAMAVNPDVISVVLSGHTDNTGSDAVNYELSLKRTRSVYNYLLSKGVDSARIVRKFYGKTQPLLPNTTSYNRSRNRRTEIVLTVKTRPEPVAEQDTTPPCPPPCEKPFRPVDKEQQLITITLSNGVIITYLGEPGETPDSLTSRISYDMLTNVEELEKKNIQTIRIKKPKQQIENIPGWIPANLISMSWIGCGHRVNCWGRDSMFIVVRIPMPDTLEYPLDSLKLFVADTLNGTIRWVPSKLDYKVERITGRTYISYSANDFCSQMGAGWICGGVRQPKLKIRRKVSSIEATIRKPNIVYPLSRVKRKLYRVYTRDYEAAEVKLKITTKSSEPVRVSLGQAKYKAKRNLYILKRKYLRP